MALPGLDEYAALLTTLQAHGVRACDFSDNEMANLHIRGKSGSEWDF